MRCNTFTEEDICGLCASQKRDASLLCVVETPADLAMMEQTLAYQGLYFVLMGRLSPLDGVGPSDIALDRLVARACDGVVKELTACHELHQRRGGDRPLHQRDLARPRPKDHADRARRAGRR